MATMHEAGPRPVRAGPPGRAHRSRRWDGRRRWASTRASAACGRTSSAARAFWTGLHPRVAADVRAAMPGCHATTCYVAINMVQPDLIRVEADEATYNLHIMLRFELERVTDQRRLAADDLPASGTSGTRSTSAWTSRTTRAAACRTSTGPVARSDTSPPTPSATCTPPSSSSRPARTFRDLDAIVRQGRVRAAAGLAQREHARSWEPLPPSELCERITGKPLSSEPLLRHLEAKLKPLYGLS